MASLFNVGPGDLLPSTSRVARSVTSSLPTSMSGSVVLYILVAVFVAVVLMMLYGSRINLSWLDIRPRRWKIMKDAYHYWKPIGPFNNLTIPQNELIPDFDNETYSMTLEILLNNSRNYWTEDGPYRHIAHRGSNELIQKPQDGVVLSSCFSAANGTLPPYGLPKRMNPGIFLDPNVNDILIFVDTSNGSETFRESVRIKDVPLDIPVRLGIVLNQRVLEVYLNCGLEVTKLLSQKPKHVENDWYGEAGIAAAKAQIQNLYLWNRALPSTDVKYICPSIKQLRVRPECPDTAPPSESQKPTVPTQTIDLGFGSKVQSTCNV